jgi:hypothetical protein
MESGRWNDALLEPGINPQRHLRGTECLHCQRRRYFGKQSKQIRLTTVEAREAAKKSCQPIAISSPMRVTPMQYAK